MCFSIQIDKDVKKIAARFEAIVSREEFVRLTQQIQNGEASNMKVPSEDGRVFPNYFAPVLVREHNQRIIHPMRYRVRPAKSKEEIPTKFNVFNARLDALTTRPTWKNIFLKQHGVIPFTKFYEWVEDAEGKKKLISFFPKDRDMMWSPCLYDYWQDPQGNFSFYSFAIITTDPPKEIEMMGHDRCPVFLKKENINAWLSANNKPLAMELLQNQEKVEYQYAWM